MNNITYDLSDVYYNLSFLAEIADAHGPEFALKVATKYRSQEAELIRDGADPSLARPYARTRLGQPISARERDSLMAAGVESASWASVA